MAVYNRYGQQIFKTTDHTKGWDGTLGGVKLTTNTFVVVSEAIDYRGKPMVKKLTVTLIR